MHLFQNYTASFINVDTRNCRYRFIIKDTKCECYLAGQDVSLKNMDKRCLGSRIFFTLKKNPNPTHHLSQTSRGVAWPAELLQFFVSSFQKHLDFLLLVTQERLQMLESGGEKLSMFSSNQEGRGIVNVLGWDPAWEGIHFPNAKCWYIFRLQYSKKDFRNTVQNLKHLSGRSKRVSRGRRPNKLLMEMGKKSSKATKPAFCSELYDQECTDWRSGGSRFHNVSEDICINTWKDKTCWIV